MFKIGIILSMIGIIWISAIFIESNKISEEFILESQHSHKIQIDLEGAGIGYYKIFMPEFLKYKIFVQVLDENKNIISEKVSIAAEFISTANAHLNPDISRPQLKPPAPENRSTK